MNVPLRVLIVEDSESDALLMLRLLRQGGYEPEHRRVESKPELEAALADGQWDIGLCDYRLPTLDGIAALKVVRDSKRDIPFILVSGAIGEDLAVALMKDGANDFVLKGNMGRLLPAIDREIREVEVRTQRREARALLRILSRALLATSAVVITDQQGRIEWVNPSLERLTGYSRDELLGQNPRILKSGKHPLAFYRNLWGTILKGKPWRGELLNKRKDGTLYPEEMTITPLPDDNGAITHFVAIKHDISTRKRAEKHLRKMNVALDKRVSERTAALRESEQHLRTIVNTAAEGILILDERGRIESINPAALIIFGHTPEEVLGQPFHRLIDSPAIARNADFVAHVLQPNDHRVIRRTSELTGRRKNGTLVSLEMALAEFTSRRRRQFVAIIHDITDRKRLERELIEVAERERRQLGHEIHDDLGQVLHGLNFLAEELQSRMEQKGIAEASELDRVRFYLSEAMARTRSLAHGLQPVPPVPEGLMSALKEHVQRVGVLYHIVCRFQCPQPVYVHDSAVATHLFRIAQEAVNNAIKHAECTRIVIQLKATSERLILAIRDNGHGRFLEKGDHCGMGLHVMRFRAAAINGSLAVQRSPRGGTEVVCSVAVERPTPFPPPDANDANETKSR
jgi:PAS domain S-box-containing protein